MKTMHFEINRIISVVIKKNYQKIQKNNKYKTDISDEL